MWQNQVVGTHSRSSEVSSSNIPSGSSVRPLPHRLLHVLIFAEGGVAREKRHMPRKKRTIKGKDGGKRFRNGTQVNSSLHSPGLERGSRVLQVAALKRTLIALHPPPNRHTLGEGRRRSAQQVIFGELDVQTGVCVCSEMLLTPFLLLV